jgi:hypothetical protein
MTLEVAVRPEFLRRPESKIQRDTVTVTVVAVTGVTNYDLKGGGAGVVKVGKNR